MSWIPPGTIPEGALRALFLAGGVLGVLGGGWLLATTPLGRFTVVAVLLVAAGLGLFKQWRDLSPR